MPSFSECPCISLSLTVAAVRVACKKEWGREIFYSNEPGGGRAAFHYCALFGKLIIIANVTGIQPVCSNSLCRIPNFSLLLFLSFEGRKLVSRYVGCTAVFFIYLFSFCSDTPRAKRNRWLGVNRPWILDERIARKKDPSLHHGSRNPEVIWIKAPHILYPYFVRSGAILVARVL